MPTTVGCIMAQHQTSCCAAVLVSLCVTFMPGGSDGCAGLVLTSSVSERNACPSEEVTFTCTAQGTAVFWGNEAFGERTMHYMSPPSRGRGFRAEIVSYDRTQRCLVSSLSFRATASRNGTTVTCTNRDRTSNQSLSLHIMSNVALENLTVVPVSLSSAQLEWKVVPSDGHHCITSYNILVSGPNGSKWEEHIPGGNNSFILSGMKLEPLKEYTYYVTANISSTHTGPTVNQASLVEIQEANPPTNLSAMMTCDNQDYKVYIEWKAPILTPLGSAPLTEYLLHFHTYDENTTIQLPLNNISTFHMLCNVTACAINITVAALNHTGPSRNNPSVYLGTLPITLYSITAVISGIIAFGCGILFASVCNHILQRHKQWRIDKKKCTNGVATQQRREIPVYEEVPTPESGSRNDMQLQCNTAYFAVQSSQ